MLTSVSVAGEATFPIEGVELGDLKPVNYLFGHNGCGKTTISRAIHDPAARHGYSGPVIRKPTGIVHYFISRSHLGNFLYWRLFRVTQSGWPKDHTQFYQQRFRDPVVWADHVKELKLFVDYCKSKQLPFSVVVFPNLRDVKRTLPITKQVANLFRQWNIPVLDLSPKLVNRNPRTLVVNAVDAHPGPALHREVAQLLYEQIAHSP